MSEDPTNTPPMFRTSLFPEGWHVRLFPSIMEISDTKGAVVHTEPIANGSHTQAELLARAAGAALLCHALTSTIPRK